MCDLPRPQTPSMSRLLIGCALALCALPAFASEEEQKPEDEAALLTRYLDLPTEERRRVLSEMPREEQAKLLARTSAKDLLSLGQRRVKELGAYRLRLTKEERVDGEVHAPQVMSLLIQSKPLAVRGEVVAGPSKGRRFLYNHAIRPRELRAREPGLLSIAGAVWVNVDSKMTRRDTRHPVTNLGYAPVLEIFQSDIRKAEAHGGHAREDEGFDASGAYCMKFTAPKAAKDLYAQKARICFDALDGLPAKIEVWDAEGLLERLAFKLEKTKVPDAAKALTLEGAGL